MPVKMRDPNQFHDRRITPKPARAGAHDSHIPRLIPSCGINSLKHGTSVGVRSRCCTVVCQRRAKHRTLLRKQELRCSNVKLDATSPRAITSILPEPLASRLACSFEGAAFELGREIDAHSTVAWFDKGPAISLSVCLGHTLSEVICGMGTTVHDLKPAFET